MQSKKGFAPHHFLTQQLNKNDYILKDNGLNPVKSFGRKSGAGFTLIELIVVIAIIAVLSAIVLVNVNGYTAKARDARRRADITQIQKALEMYYADNSRYPNAGGATSPNGGWSNSADASWNSLQNLIRPYLAKLPVDPIENYDAAKWAVNGYHYSYVGCTQTYMLVFNLEVAGGPDPGAWHCGTRFYQYGGTGANTKVKTYGFSKLN